LFSFSILIYATPTTTTTAVEGWQQFVSDVLIPESKQTQTIVQMHLSSSYRHPKPFPNRTTIPNGKVDLMQFEGVLLNFVIITECRWKFDYKEAASKQANTGSFKLKANMKVCRVDFISTFLR